MSETHSQGFLGGLVPAVAGGLHRCGCEDLGTKDPVVEEDDGFER